ncbi:MAG TPA: LysR family transcriptional regulator [Ilumatobacter sp.]|nr:LysR family transcriptional regulator [Ilumatobacter sp.]
MIDTPLLVALQAIAHAGTVSGAAARLSLSPSAVSQQLARLERMVGLPLFERTQRRMLITPAGETLLATATDVLARLAALDEVLAAHRGSTRGRLHVGTFPSAGATIVPPLLAALLRARPDVDVELSVGEPFELEPAVSAGDVDVAFVYRYARVPSAWPPGLWRRHIRDDPLWLALPATHRLAGRRQVRLRELAGESWISTGPETAGETSLQRATAEAGFAPDVRHRTRDYEMTQSLVAAGLGVAVIPELCLDLGGRSGVAFVRPADKLATREVFLIGRDSAVNPLVTELVGVVGAGRPPARRASS